MHYIKYVYRNYATFDGRARRAEYWTFVAFFMVVVIVGALISKLGSGLQFVAEAAFGLFVLGSFIPALALRVRRLHDINRSGFWIFIGLLPIIGALVLLVLSLMPGTRGTNRFGADPKGAGSEMSEVFA
jgi:uncharacterized membrane protein YhaH (DUF805 family)